MSFIKDFCPLQKDSSLNVHSEALVDPPSQPTRSPAFLRTLINYPRPLGPRVAGSPASTHACRAGLNEGMHGSVCHAVTVSCRCEASRGRFTVILGSLSSQSAPKWTSATHLWALMPTEASYCHYGVKGQTSWQARLGHAARGWGAKLRASMGLSG